MLTIFQQVEDPFENKIEQLYFERNPNVETNVQKEVKLFP